MHQALGEQVGTDPHAFEVRVRRASNGRMSSTRCISITRTSSSILPDILLRILHAPGCIALRRCHPRQQQDPRAFTVIPEYGSRIILCIRLLALAHQLIVGILRMSPLPLPRNNLQCAHCELNMGNEKAIGYIFCMRRPLNAGLSTPTALQQSWRKSPPSH